MAIDVTYKNDIESVVLEYGNSVSGSELIETISHLFKDKRFPSLKYWISDRSACKEYLVDTPHVTTIKNMTQKAAKNNPQLIRILVSPEDHMLGISQMYQLITEGPGFKTMIFHDRKEVDRWLIEQKANTYIQ